MKKAREYVRRGRAVIERGLLRFHDDLEPDVDAADARGPIPWNGSPKPRIMRKVSLRSTEDPFYRHSVSRRPGEVRS